MSWQKINELLPQETKQLQQRAQVEGAQVCRLWQEYAGRFFLERIIKNHEAINFREGVLTITVANPEYLSELRAQQYKIIGLINQALGKRLVKTVRYLA